MILLAMIVEGFFVQIMCSNNSLLYTYPIMLIMVPVALAIDGVVTFIPKWMVEGKLKVKLRMVVLLLAVYVIVIVLNYSTRREPYRLTRGVRRQWFPLGFLSL